MAQQKSTVEINSMVDAISRFLRSPPEGTPAEIIEAFDVDGAREFLPPKLFLETVEQAPIAISITDPKAQILYVNRAFEQLTGYLRSEIVGENESVLSSDSTPESVYLNLWESIQAGRLWKGLLVNHGKDKKEYLAELTISPVFTPQGDIAYYLGMHRDITEVHQLEQRLKFQSALTEAAVDAAPMVVSIVDSDRKIVMDNNAYKALMTDLQGAEPAVLFLDALEQQIGFGLGKNCRVGRGFNNIEVRIESPGNSTPRWFSCSGVRVDEMASEAASYFKQGSENRCYLLLIANEVTASRQRANEARINLIRAHMAEQQMSQTIGEALSGAIFKLQEPLNIIRAALSMPGSGGDQTGLRGVLRHALESADDAVDSLQDALPGLNNEQQSPVNINEILHDVISLSTEKLLSTGVVIDWRPVAVIPAIVGRENALRGLFKYLIDNAMYAVDEAVRPEREIRLETSVDEQEIVIEVIDNGPGVQPNQRLKIFEPFFCGWKSSREHAGMGLTMAQEVALSHRGSVEIDPGFLGGCRVVVRLPITADGGG